MVNDVNIIRLRRHGHGIGIAKHDRTVGGKTFVGFVGQRVVIGRTGIYITR